MRSVCGAIPLPDTDAAPSLPATPRPFGNTPIILSAKQMKAKPDHGMDLSGKRGTKFGAKGRRGPKFSANAARLSILKNREPPLF